jgi:hypothetical protein
MVTELQGPGAADWSRKLRIPILYEYRVTEAKTIVGARKLHQQWLYRAVVIAQIALVLFWLVGIIVSPAHILPWVAGVVGLATLAWYGLASTVPETRLRPRTQRFAPRELVDAWVENGRYCVVRNGLIFHFQLADVIGVQRAIGVVRIQLESGKIIYFPSPIFPDALLYQNGS